MNEVLRCVLIRRKPKYIIYRACLIPLSAALSSASAALNAARASRSLLLDSFVSFIAASNANPLSVSCVSFFFRLHRIALRIVTFILLYKVRFPLRCCGFIHASNFNLMPSSMMMVAAEATSKGAWGIRFCEENLQARLIEGNHQLDIFIDDYPLTMYSESESGPTVSRNPFKRGS